MRRALVAPALLVLSASSAAAAVQPGLAGAQDLFRRNRWAEARAHLRAQWSALPQKDQGAARYLIGRSFVREAEFYRAVRQVGLDVGQAYLKELAAVRSNRSLGWLPLFTAFYQLEAGRHAEAERGLRAAAALPSLSPEWKARARLRRAVALHRLGRGAEAAAALDPATVEGRFWRLVLTHASDAQPVAARSRLERLLGAALELRASRSAAAEVLLEGLDPDLPDAEARPDASKTLRFYDPVWALVWERLCWERAVIALRPLAAGGTGVERTLGSYFIGVGLSRLGLPREAERFLAEASRGALSPELQPRARLLAASASWQERVPPAAELQALWQGTQGQLETVLDWDELSRAELLRLEPFASRLGARLENPLPSSPERPSGATVGRWALVRLHRGAEPGSLLSTLSEHRDDSNKNKLDWNDPLLLLALTAANHADGEYAQALETLFELSKSFPALRWLQWNLQGIYAARQKAGGETRISQ